MPPTILDSIPTIFHAGETVKWRHSPMDFPPADGWTYTIYFNGPSENFNKQADTDASGFLITLNPNDLAVAPGIYRYQERVSNNSGEVYTIGVGVVQIEPDFATAEPGVTLSFAEQMLAAVEAEIKARVAADVESYSIQASVLGGGRSVSKIPMEQLERARGRWASMVWRQKNPGKIGAPVEVHFTDTTQNQEFPPTWVDVTGLQGAGQ